MIRQLINSFINEKIEDKNDVAILFSGGLDSLSILYSCLDLSIQPILYTFYLDSYVSEDIISSRRIATNLDLKLNEIVISTKNVDDLIHDVKYVIKKYNVFLKTQVQCIYPFLYVIPYIKEKYILSGLCADDLYGSSRSMGKLRNNIDQYNKIRQQKIDNIHTSSYFEIKSMVEEYNKIFIAPYKEDVKIIEYFMKQADKEMNHPKQKMLTYLDYKKEIDDLKLYRRNQNLQCVSKIREWHDELLKTSLNTKNYKMVSPIYKNIYNNEI